MVKKIINVQNPILRKKSKKVLKIDKKITSLIQDMKDTLKAQDDPEGVGLAAPQISKNLQIFLMNFEGTEKVVINPEVVSVGKTLDHSEKAKKKRPLEGCLSLPHYYGPITRANKIKIKYMDEDGKPQVEEFRGFLAQIVQHELDHLKGVIFIDRLLEQKEKLFKFEGDDWEEVEL